jgi:hypothetical protein
MAADKENMAESIGGPERRQTATQVLKQKARALIDKGHRLMALAKQLEWMEQYVRSTSPDGEDSGPYLGAGSDAEVALWEMAQEVKV